MRFEESLLRPLSTGMFLAFLVFGIWFSLGYSVARALPFVVFIPFGVSIAAYGLGGFGDG